MQFTRNGPNIPDRLLRTHEDGQVVFFCGAGISAPAGLPGFADLVNRLYKHLSVTPNSTQRAAIKSGQYDIAINLLVRDLAGGYGAVFSALSSLLKPDLSKLNATKTHEALLTLAETRQGRIRLITTNIDRLFEKVIDDRSLSVQRFVAPLLPVPKNQWDGLVYLHGRLSPEGQLAGSDRLVLSSGDFGLAYLTERWAARFVSELFRRFTVCFIGYSLNDPVMRYITDALAADRQMGKSVPEVFAFACHRKREDGQTADEWHAKGVTPLLYGAHNHHTYLHRTLHAWSETYRDGIRGRLQILRECTMTPPQASTVQDDHVGRLLWALSDPTGKAAEHFADLNPVPSLEWLDPISDERFGYADLEHFDIRPFGRENKNLTFSLVRRPSPFQYAPWMTLVDAGSTGSRLDPLIRHLARWLTRHLDDPRLVLWLAQRGGRPHVELATLVEQRLAEIVEDGRAENVTKLDEIRTNAPKAIPDERMRTLWRLLLSGRLKSNLQDFDLLDWRTRFLREGLNPGLKSELRELLTPCVSLRSPIRLPMGDAEDFAPAGMTALVEWEIVLHASYVHESLRYLGTHNNWKEVLPDLLDDLCVLLRDALDLKQVLGGADTLSDLSYMHQPSISHHSQNTDFYDWTALIVLARDAWLATAERSPNRAAYVAASWWQVPYPTFKRLALFAATQISVITTDQAMDWLLAEGAWWLWSAETQREALRLLVTVAPHLDDVSSLRLEHAILAGPPRALYRDEIELEEWTRIVDEEIWLRLEKLSEEAGVCLGNSSSQRLTELSAEHPDWLLAVDERNDFPFFWTTDSSEWHKTIQTPHRCRDLVDWLKRHPARDLRNDDEWRRRGRDHFPATLCALCILASQEIWIPKRWAEVFYAWEKKIHLRVSWRHLSPLLVRMPDADFRIALGGISWWVESVAGVFEDHESLFLSVIDRILSCNHAEAAATDEHVFQALNHPVGHATQALLKWWYRGQLEEGQGLPEALRARFDVLCDVENNMFRHARVLLASNVITLFHVAPAWTTEHVLPLFDWNRSILEAEAAWSGFLTAPRLDYPLLLAIKPEFLETVNHYHQLKILGTNHVALLTLVALDLMDGFSTSELAKATRTLNGDGLKDAARTIWRSLESAGEARQAHWTNRITPYFRKIWPQTRQAINPAIAETLAECCIAAGDAFPDALATVKDWLLTVRPACRLVYKLKQSGLCARFPEDALEFLNRVIGEKDSVLPSKLEACLDEICGSKPELAEDRRFLRLSV